MALSSVSKSLETLADKINSSIRWPLCSVPAKAAGERSVCSSGMEDVGPKLPQPPQPERLAFACPICQVATVGQCSQQHFGDEGKKICEMLI